MDPEGVREVFYAFHGTAPNYGVRNAIRELPFVARWQESRFVGLHLPLTKPLPKRIDVGLQQHVGLHRCDAVVLAGIDPVVFDADDLLNLLAYVESGGGLLLMGGSSSFDKAQRGWGPLRDALPASITPLYGPRRPKRHGHGAEEKALLGVSPAQPHPVTRGLSGPLGSVANVQPIEAQSGATVLVTADGQPLIVAGEHLNGRVIMVASHPDGNPCDMFASPGYADLLRQAMTWLMNRPDDLVIERCEVDHSPIQLGEGRTLSLEVAAQAAGPLRAGALVSRADPGWLSTGREPQFGAPQPQPVEIGGHAVEFRFEPTEPGLWRIQLDVEGEGWANRRFAHIEVQAPLGLTLTTRQNGYVTAPGRALPLELGARQSVRAALRVIDFDGEEVCRQDGADAGPVDFELPQLELGHYEVVAQADGEEARLRFYVAQPQDRIPFTLCATTGSGSTEEQTRWLYEYFRDRGFNGHARPNAYGQYLAQREGADIWGEYVGASLLRTGHDVANKFDPEGTATTDPCIFDPAYEPALRSALKKTFDAWASIPRGTSLEILDEPHLYRANVCHCERCQARYRERFGYDMPTWDEALAAKDHRTRDYFEWVVDYCGEAFRKGLEMWRSFGPGPKLHHVLCGMGSGHASAAISVSEDLPWSEHADFVEFDCYNYMYAHWRASEHIRWNEFHYLFGNYRFQTLRNNQRLGFFIQVTDRDVPVSPWDPLRAPSETRYSAIGQGAKTFHLMAKMAFTSGQNCREEKFDTFAEDIRKVQRAAPLLDRAECPRSRIAMTFPFHDRLYRVPPHRLPEGYTGLGFYTRAHRPYDTLFPYHIAPVNVAELLFRAFGEVDVIDQRAFHEGALEDYPAFVLNTTDYITDEDAAAVVRFVECGGTLICDHVPSHSTSGNQIDALQPLFDGETEHFYRHVTVTRATFGKGRTLLFSDDLNELYTGSIEQNQPVLRYRLKDTIREFLHAGGVRPYAFSSNYEVEANVLLTDDTVVLVCVSHAEDRQQGHVTLFDPAVPATCAFDLVTMQPYPIERTELGIELDVDLDEREGLILGLYAEAPTQSAVKLDRATVRRGSSLAFSVMLTDAGGRPARGDQIVNVCVTDPKGEERPQFGGLLCATNGELRIDKPLAVNARAGTWTITAFDRFTTREVTARFSMQP